MFGLRTKKDTAERVRELRSAIEKATDRLEAERTRLGEAIADGDQTAATKARGAVNRHRAQLEELQVALPAAERRLEAARAKAVAAERARQAAEANEARKARLAAARGVDEAWKALQGACEALLATAIGGASEDRMRVGRRAQHAHQAAAYHWAPALSERLGVPRVNQGHRRPLADAESASIREMEP